MSKLGEKLIIRCLLLIINILIYQADDGVNFEPLQHWQDQHDDIRSYLDSPYLGVGE